MHTAGSTYYSLPLRHSMRPSFAIEGSYLLRLLLHRQSGGVVVVCMWVSVCVCVLWCSKSWHKLVSYVVESPFSESCQGLYRVKVGWGCSLLALLRLLLLSVRRSKEKRRRRKRHTTLWVEAFVRRRWWVVVVSTMPRVRPISLDTLLANGRRQSPIFPSSSFRSRCNNNWKGQKEVPWRRGGLMSDNTTADGDVDSANMFMSMLICD